MAKSRIRKNQSQKFTDAARELGVDENETHFKAKLRKVARADVPPEQRKKPKRSSKLSE